MKAIRPFLASAAAVAGLIVLPSAASAQTSTCPYPQQCPAQNVTLPQGGTQGNVQGGVQGGTQSNVQGGSALGATASRGAARGGTLPVTGGDVVGLVALGAGAVGAGAAATMASRRKAARAR